MSVANDLLSAGLLALQGLGLALPGTPPTPLAVDARKLPTAEEVLDAVPLLAWVPEFRPTEDEPYSTAGQDGKAKARRTYTFAAVLVTAGNADPRANLALQLDWRQKVTRAFGSSKPLAVPELLLTRTALEAAFDRGAYSKLYDYNAVSVRFVCVEPGQ